MNLNSNPIMKYIKYLLYCLIISISTSCIWMPEPIGNYKGSVLYMKKNPPAGYKFIIKYKTEDSIFDFKTVYVMEFDYNKYNIGDTIK